MFFIPGFDFLSFIYSATKSKVSAMIKCDEKRSSQCALFRGMCLCLFMPLSCGRVSPQASQQSSPQAVWVVPALRQLHEITRSFIKQTYQKQDKVTQTDKFKKKKLKKKAVLCSPVNFSFTPKSIIQDLKKNFEIVKLITGSLVCCHRLAVTAGGNNGLSGSTLVDGRYTYQEVGIKRH